MKEFLMGLVSAAIVGAAFLAGRSQTPPAPAQPAPREEAQGPRAEWFDPGQEATVSLYNPDGRLLKYFQVEGRVEVRPLGYLVFRTADGKVVRTNGSFIVEGTGSAATAVTTSASP